MVARKRPHGDRRELRGKSDCLRSRVRLSSRASGRGQHGVLETSTAAETVVRRKGTRIALYLKPDRLDLQLATKELTHDVQTPSMLSMLRLRWFAWYLVGGADLSPFFACSDETSTILVLADVDWSADTMTCNVRWCCAAGESLDRSVECDCTGGGVVQRGRK